MLRNRRGESADAKAGAAVALAKALNDNVGEITGAEFDAARTAGLSDGEIVEVISVVALNIFTNIIGKATRVEIDFPKVALLEPSGSRRGVSSAAAAVAVSTPGGSVHADPPLCKGSPP